MSKANSIYNIPAGEYNIKLMEILKKMPEFEQPEWSFFIKSGPGKKRPPQDKDFWHKRAASILRQGYIQGIIGVNRLKTRYGSKKNRGYKPEKFVRASGKIIRTILQQAEKAGLLEKHKSIKKRSGRKLTLQGRELLESIK